MNKILKLSSLFLAVSIASVGLIGCGGDGDDDNNGGNGGGGNGGGGNGGGGNGGGGAPQAGGTVFAVDSNNMLISFDRNTPETLLSGPTLITGHAGTILGFDFRPADGQLYMLTDADADIDGNTGTLYTVDTTSAVATLGQNLVDDGSDATAFSGLGAGTAFGVDFNPAADRLRVTSDADLNLRINVDNGMTLNDGTLGFAGGDANAAANPNIVASAYTNSFAGTGSTMLYDIDSTLDILADQTPPNAGTLNTAGATGVDSDNNIGFDIDGSTGDALAALNPAGTSTSALYDIDLASGAASNSRPISDGTLTITGLAIPTPTPATVFITNNTNLMSFSITDPTNVTDIGPITGITGDILGIDFRPATGDLYLLTDGDQDADTVIFGTLYTVDTTTAAATVASNLDTSIATLTNFPSNGNNVYAVDFNPVTDRLRVIDQNTNQNLRINVDTGETIVDTSLVYDAADANNGAEPQIAAAGYSNSVAGATSTTLFDIDAALDIVADQTPANSGTLNTIGSLTGVNVTSGVTTFDISDQGLALATLSLGPNFLGDLYRIDVTTGTATMISTIGAGNIVVQGMSVAPTP